MKRGTIHLYKFYINNITNTHYYEELTKVFFSRNQYEIIIGTDGYEFNEGSFAINKIGSDNRDDIVRELYHKLCELTGHEHTWGTLTGVRPLKPAILAYEKHKNINDTKAFMKSNYMISEEKANLLMDILNYQLSSTWELNDDDISVYIGIPFCPTRCSYCSFTSNIPRDGEIDRYLNALYKEIEFLGTLNKSIETIYIGGGTPNILDERQLEELLNKIDSNLNLKNLKEYSFEAGRPDTINVEKLNILKKYGVDRISINPQTFNEKTLIEIGRDHSIKEVYDAYSLAKGLNGINSDLIAGLPGEGIGDFENTLDKMIEIYPENITVHSLSIKRGSKLDETHPNYYRESGELVAQMLDLTYEKLRNNGYAPYYIYRQKHMAGALENVGYMRDDKSCLYNIRIMNERQSILALGAGGISKVVYPKENRHERVPNVSNYEIYIDRIDEMIDRKKGYVGGK